MKSQAAYICDFGEKKRADMNDFEKCMLDDLAATQHECQELRDKMEELLTRLFEKFDFDSSALVDALREKGE